MRNYVNILWILIKNDNALGLGVKETFATNESGLFDMRAWGVSCTLSPN